MHILITGVGRTRAIARRASGIRVLEFGIRRQHASAIFGARQRRSSRFAVRGHQKGQRADGAQLCALVRHALHRTQVFHRLAHQAKAQTHPRRVTIAYNGAGE